MLLIGSSVEVAAAPTMSGTRIINVAGATYFNPNLGVTETVYSNTVEAIVADVPAIEVAGFSDLTLSRGTADQHHFEVMNMGNTDLAVNMAIALSGDANVVEGGVLYWDRDADASLTPMNRSLIPAMS